MDNKFSITELSKIMHTTDKKKSPGKQKFTQGEIFRMCLKKYMREYKK